jgi:hypothetical protein
MLPHQIRKRPTRLPSGGIAARIASILGNTQPAKIQVSAKGAC